MTIKALTGLVPQWYTPKSEEDEGGEVSKFELTPLTSPQIAKLQRHFNRETGEVTGEGLYEAAKLGITAWDNVQDQDGNPFAFSKKNIDVLPYATLVELGGEILASSFVTGDDEKN